jgi:hypothetical protein
VNRVRVGLQANNFTVLVEPARCGLQDNFDVSEFSKRRNDRYLRFSVRANGWNWLAEDIKHRPAFVKVEIENQPTGVSEIHLF